MSASRNVGIRQARGDYIALLDADDVWLSTKLERQVEILEAHPDSAMLYGAVLYWRSWTNLPSDRERDAVADVGVQALTRFDPPALLTRVYPLGRLESPCPCSVMIRTEVARSLGGFEQEFTGFYEDQAFFCKVYLSHSVLVSEETLARYRIHSDQCCAQVWKAGLYPKYRRLFLDWLRGHLQTQHITDARIWKTLHEAEQSLQLLQEDQDDRLKRGDSRLLRVEKGFEARLESAPDPFDWVRVTIVEAGSGNSYDIQLNLAHLRARVGHRYLLSFKARADAPRSALFGFAQGHSPWANLGCYERIELTPEWQSFSKSFAVAAADENARIHFDLGDVAIPVEFSEITLRDGTAGEMLKSAAPATKNEFSTWWDSE